MKLLLLLLLPFVLTAQGITKNSTGAGSATAFYTIIKRATAKKGPVFI
jgi:hypothetical protein